jgi:hypothetical protein
MWAQSRIAASVLQLLAIPHSLGKLSAAKVGAVKVAVGENFGAVEGRKGAVVLDYSSREGSTRPGNPERQDDPATGLPVATWTECNCRPACCSGPCMDQWSQLSMHELVFH